MQRDLTVFTTAFALSLTALTPALAGGEWTQLIAGTGLTPAEAQGLSLEQITIYKYNRSSRPQDAIGVDPHQEAVGADRASHGQLVRSAGLWRDGSDAMSLNEVFAYKLDRDNADDLALLKTNEPEPVDPWAHAQLIAGVGISPEEAAGMTLNSVALLKFVRETD